MGRGSVERVTRKTHRAHRRAGKPITWAQARQIATRWLAGVTHASQYGKAWWL